MRYDGQVKSLCPLVPAEYMISEGLGSATQTMKKKGGSAGPGRQVASQHGNTKRKNAKQRSAPVAAAVGENTSKNSSNKKKIEELYVKAQIAIMSDQYEQADEFFAGILALAPREPEYLDAYGSFLAEYVPHKRQEAIEYLRRACELAPTTGFEKFMYLGQVLDACGQAREAEAAMRAGVEILKSENDAQNSNGEFLTSALCSLAELLMGLIHDDDDMMDECYASASALPELSEVEALLEQAMTTSRGKSPEPLQAMCGLRVLQGREEEALGLLKESLKLWWEGGDGDDNDNDDDDEGDDDRDRPSYEFRFETAKLLLELDATTDTAAEILEELLDENDMVPDVWLLLAVAYRAGGEVESAQEAAVNGAKVAHAIGERPDDNEVVFALGELATELGKEVGQREKDGTQPP